MSTNRQKYNASEKLKIAAEALVGHMTQNQITKQYHVHSTQINRWKKRLREMAAEIFKHPNKKNAKELEQSELIEELFRKVGQLEMERDWLKKKSELFE